MNEQQKQTVQTIETNAVDLDQVMAATMQKLIVNNDMSVMSDDERYNYYNAICKSLGLNPLTRPFEYIELPDREKGPDAKKLVLYATKSCTDQLRSVHKITVKIVDRRTECGLYIVTARAIMADGREDEDCGAVAIERENGTWESAKSGKRYFKGDGSFKPLSGDALANSIMKSTTKAKRRVTLSICGLGMLDESEIETIPGARPVADTTIVPPNVKAEVVEVPALAQSVIDAAIEPIASIHTTDDLIAHYKKQAANVKTDARFVEALSQRKLAILNETIDGLAFKLEIGSVEVGMIAAELGIDMETMNSVEAQYLVEAMTKQLAEKNSAVVI